MSDILHRGARWPVTDHWHDANTAPFPHLAELTRDELRTAQDDLLRKSEQSISERLGNATAEEIAALPESVRQRLAEASLTPAEHALLKAANNHYDVRTAIDFLAGRPLSDFGFEGVDQVHGNRQHLECGCKLHWVFDHHRRHDTDDTFGHNERRLHPHFPHAVCARHAHLTAGPLDELHAVVTADQTPEIADAA
jgi:hypothetical protein